MAKQPDAPPTSIRFPHSMHAQITDAAKAAGLSRNAFVVAAVQRSIDDPLSKHETALDSRPDVLDGLKHAAERPEELKPRERPSAMARAATARETAAPPTAAEAPPTIEIECRQAASKWQWRVVGEDQPGGVVSFRRDIAADAKVKLAARFGHPVDVHLR